jgi:hypothetical protein
MKRKFTFVCVAAALVGAFALGRAGAQEGTHDMKAWEALGATGPEHAKMLKTVGTWNCECKAWMMPGAEPMLSKGKAVRTEALGGRFIREDFEGDMMGQPFKGFAYNGFNNATKKYELVWLDSMSTGMMFMSGTEAELKGSFFGPGGIEVKSRATIKEISPDQMVMEMYNNMGTGEMKCMEMTYTRAK